MVEYLLKQGASVHMRDRDRRTPLLVAIDWDHHDVIDLLVRGGSHLSLPPETLAESMNSAARKGDIRRLESYRRAGANLADKDTAGRTAAHAAAECRQIEVMAYLLEYGFYTEATDVYGHTAKDIASILGHQDLVTLIEENRRPSNDDDDERSSLQGSDAGSDRLSTSATVETCRLSDSTTLHLPRQSPSPRPHSPLRSSRESLPGSTADSLTGYFSASPPMRSDTISNVLSSSTMRRQQQLGFATDNTSSFSSLMMQSPARRNGHILLNGFAV